MSENIGTKEVGDDFVLPKAYRLRKNEEFKRVYSSAKSFSTKYLVLYIKKNNVDNYRVGFSISKKIGKAHVRNRCKRQMREIIRLSSQHILPGWDLIILARKPIIDLNYPEMENNIKYLLRKSGVWHD